MHIVWIVLGIIIAVAVLLLWSTVAADIASNGRKTIIGFRMLGFIRYEIVIPPEKTVKPAKNKNKKQRKKKDRRAALKKRTEEAASAVWDDKAGFLDLDGIKERTEHYAELYRTAKGMLGAFLRIMKKKVRFDRLDLYLHFGLGEADSTGMAYGGAYSLWYILLPMLDSYFVLRRPPGLYLDPDYNSRCFDFETGIIIKTRAAHVLHGLLAALMVYILKYVKGSVRNVRNVR